MVKNRELSKIEEILHERFIAEDQTQIEERNKDGNGKPFVMKRKIVGHSTIEYKLYRFDPDTEKLFPYFKEVSGLHQICDYFIFAEDNGRFFIFLVELKRHQGSPIKQLDISESFVQFILSRAEKIKKGITKKVHIRKLGIKDSKIAPKRATGYYKNLSFDENKYLMIQSGTAIRLAQLMDFTIDGSST